MERITAKTVFIINPRAANGKAGKKWPEISQMSDKFFSSSQVLFTDGPGGAEKFAAQTVEAGVEKVVCVGGDGTMNEVINGLMSREAVGNGRPALGYLPFGTGCDLARTLKISRNLEQGVRDIANKEGRWMDLGKATFLDHDGQTVNRYFHNVLSFGLGGEVAARINRSSKVLGDFLSFLGATLATVFFYRKPLVRLRVDERFDKHLVCLHVAVANGCWHGGGMLVAPDAKPDDGKFTITVIGDLTIPEVLLNLPNLYNGRIYSVDKVSHIAGKRVEVSAEDKVPVDLDGEQPGYLPLTVEIKPRALWMIA